MKARFQQQFYTLALSTVCFTIQLLSFNQAIAQQAQSQKSRLVINKIMPAGKLPTSFSYTPQTGVDPAAVRGILLYYTNKHIYAIDLSAQLEAGALKGEFIIPDSAQAIVLAFKTGEGRNTKVDQNEGAGYVFPIADKSGPIPGSLAAMALFYSDPSGEFFTGVKQDFPKSLQLMEAEFKQHPKLASDWLPEYLIVLANHNREAGIKLLQKTWAREIKGAVLEERMLQIIKSAEAFVSEQQLALMKEDVLRVYPMGMLALEKAANLLQSDLSPTGLEPGLKQLIDKFKGQKEKLNPGSLDYMYGVMAKYAADQRDGSKFRYYTALLTNRQINAEADNYAANLYLKDKTDLGHIDSISFDAIRLIKIQQEINKKMSAYYSPAERGNELEPEMAQYLDTYAQICAAKGDESAALNFQQQSIEISRIYPERNGHYVDYLLRLKKYDEARQEGESFVKAGTSDESIKKGLQLIYEHKHHDTLGFSSYFEQLDNKAASAENQKVLTGLIDMPASAFELKDLNGNTVSLASLKGKIVILDFWATWCGPCKASFPAMQTVINKYKADKNVVFLFINTWESNPAGERYKMISDLMLNGKYSFRILADTGGIAGHYYIMADDYKLKAVPTKIIIDGNGRIRFRTEGFSGTTKALENELTAMIETIKGLDNQ